MGRRGTEPGGSSGAAAAAARAALMRLNVAPPSGCAGRTAGGSRASSALRAARLRRKAVDVGAPVAGATMGDDAMSHARGNVLTGRMSISIVAFEAALREPSRAASMPAIGDLVSSSSAFHEHVLANIAQLSRSWTFTNTF